jgi:hypothetical protein
VVSDVKSTLKRFICICNNGQWSTKNRIERIWKICVLNSTLCYTLRLDLRCCAVYGWRPLKFWCSGQRVPLLYLAFLLGVCHVVKGKAVPLHTMEAPAGRGGIASTHSQPRHWMGVSSQHHAPAALYPRGKDPRYPLYRRLGGPQSRYGRRS